jgi:hypothetical protein
VIAVPATTNFTSGCCVISDVESVSAHGRGKKMKIKTKVKSGGIQLNHNQSLMKMKTKIKAGTPQIKA